MKSILIGTALFAVLLIVGGSAASTMSATAAGGNEKQSSGPGGISEPSKIKETFSRAFVSGSWSTDLGGGAFEQGTVFIDQEKGSEVGTLWFFFQSGHYVDCGDEYFGFVGFRQEGTGGGVVDVNTSQGGSGSGHAGVVALLVNECLGTTLFLFNSSVDIPTEVQGESFYSNKFASCFDGTFGRFCTKGASKGGDGPATTTVNGSDHAGYGNFGESKSSFTFTPN